MKVIIPVKEANSYMAADGFSVTQMKDRFLYSNVTKVRRESSSSSGKGGLRTGSSGRTHGGRSGRF